MLVKILGGADVVVGVTIILLGAGIDVPWNILLAFAIFLLFKAGMGYISDVTDIASWIDFIGFLVLLISILINIPGIISIIIGFLILQKGILSFL